MAKVRGRPRLSHANFLRINRFRRVRGMLTARAQAVAVAAQSNLLVSGVDAKVTMESGIRPKGRAYVRVQHGDPWGEYGTVYIKRHRALGRAAR